jgi:hypothetical protein
VRQLSIDQLDNEGRRVSIYDKGTPEHKTPMFQRTVSMPGVHKRVINELLRPRQWKPNHEDRHFMLSVSSGCVVCRAHVRCSVSSVSMVLTVISAGNTFQCRRLSNCVSTCLFAMMSATPACLFSCTSLVRPSLVKMRVNNT